MRHILIIATFFFASTKTFAYNPFWTHTDKKLISSIINLDKNNPKQIEQYFKTQRIQKSDTTKEVLGFGWTIWTPGIGGGYISISAEFYYFHDSLVSYTLTPNLPEEKGLVKRYKKWYRDFFPYLNSEIQSLKFNEVAILKPLKEYEGTFRSIPQNIISYMTPNSGTMYGYAGGGVIMQNRKAFLEIQDSLSNDQVILLMYSINPASRLTAIEYYLKYKERFSSQQQIDKWIDLVFAETPTVKTMSGCFPVTETTETLFRRYYIDKYYR
jgi:hypothetical protein